MTVLNCARIYHISRPFDGKKLIHLDLKGGAPKMNYLLEVRSDSDANFSGADVDVLRFLYTNLGWLSTQVDASAVF